MKSKGFTLVELLAVIVILGIILLIAVPKITATIDSSKSASIESSTKMVAAEAEREYTIRKTLDDNTEITCDDVASLSSNDYDACSINFNDSGVATVSITGKGKFDGYTCRGTKDSVQCAENGELLATAEYCFATKESVIYTIKNYDSCTTYMANPDFGLPAEDIQTLCSGEIIYGNTTTVFLLGGIEYGMFTEQDLLDNNVINKESLGVTITGYSDTCEKDIIIPSSIGGKAVNSIGDFAFTTYGDMVEISLNSNNTIEPMLLNYTNKNEVNPTFIVSIPPCEGLDITSVIIPNSVTSIGRSAFGYNLLSEVVIPSSVTNIYDNAFVSNNITSVTFPTSELSVGCGIFSGNEGLELTYPSNVTDTCPPNA